MKIKIKALQDLEAIQPGISKLKLKKGDIKEVDDRVGRHLVLQKKAEKVEESAPEHAAD